MTMRNVKIFRAVDMKGQERRKKNTISSTKILSDEGVAFESKNNGAHLIVTGKNGLINFWPSTGLFITLKGFKGRGVFNLMKLCDKHPLTTKQASPHG